MIVSLLTDYGHDDEFVGVCHGVIRSIHPEAEIIDLAHGIHRYDVRHGALVLRNTLPYLPPGVHVGVVDPQVGTERRALALQTGDGRLLVGPDNGLLSLAWERCGGVAVVVDVTRSRTASSPCPPPSTAATCSRRWRPTSRPARRSRTPATPWSPTGSPGSSSRLPGRGRRSGGARARRRSLRQRHPGRGPRAAVR